MMAENIFSCVVMGHTELLCLKTEALRRILVLSTIWNISPDKEGVEVHKTGKSYLLVRKDKNIL